MQMPIVGQRFKSKEGEYICSGCHNSLEAEEVPTLSEEVLTANLSSRIALRGLKL